MGIPLHVILQHLKGKEEGEKVGWHVPEVGEKAIVQKDPVRGFRKKSTGRCD